MERFRLIALTAILLVVFPFSGGSQDSEETVVPEGATASPTSARSTVLERGPMQRADEHQIRVTGENPLQRTLFRVYAEDLRRSFRWSIYRYRPGEHTAAAMDRDFWTIPIRIELWGDMSDVFRGDGFRTEIEVRPDGRFHIRIAVRLHDGFDDDRFRLEMMRVLLLEQMLMPVSEQPETLPVGTLTPPPWMVHGFDELFAHRESGSPSAFYDGALRSGQILTPAKLFAVEDPDSLDPLSYAIFRASSAAMVEALLDQSGGDAGFREILGDLGTKKGARVEPLLRQYFPAFREMEEGMEKWWTLQVAALGQQQSFEFMDREETERWLNEAITVRISDEPDPLPTAAKRKGFLERLRSIGPKSNKETPSEPFTGPIDQYTTYLGRDGAKEALARSFSRLQQLKVTGHPAYRPVLQAYEKIIEDLSRKKTGTIDAQLAAASDLRNTIQETLIRTEDYLNHYEATRSPNRSAAFDAYHEMRRKLEKTPPPRRTDRISRYLDGLEVEFR